MSGNEPPTQPEYGYQPGYTVYPYPPPYPVVAPPNDSIRAQAIGSLICNCVVTTMCCMPIAIGGIVLSAMAISRADRDAVSARKLVIWSWAVLASSILLGIAAFVVIIVAAMSSP